MSLFFNPLHHMLKTPIISWVKTESDRKGVTGQWVLYGSRSGRPVCLSREIQVRRLLGRMEGLQGPHGSGLKTKPRSLPRSLYFYLQRLEPERNVVSTVFVRISGQWSEGR